MLNGKTMAMLGLAGILTLPTTMRAQTSACGDPMTEFSVKKARGTQPAAVPADKALVYFVERDVGVLMPPTTRVGVDGQWIGATHGASYFSYAMQPGVHHLCAMTQTSDKPDTALAHFTAKAGETYYFEVKALAVTRGSGTLWTERSLTPLDSDEGAMLVRDDVYGTARENK